MNNKALPEVKTAEKTGPSNQNRVNKKCRQLIYLYQGKFNGLMMDPLAFIAGTKILNRNICMFRDQDRTYYHGRIDNEMTDIQATLNWQLGHKNALFAHTDELYCGGTSNGAYAAILCGHYLKADAVYAFSPQTVIDPSRIIAGISIPRAHLDLCDVLANSNGKTRFNIYYCEDNEVDRAHAEHISHCPNVSLHPVAGDSHNILATEGGKAVLPDLFPSFK
ncbi:MAG: hypothetical protein V7744_19890 [Pseudomonadales bacterium]